MVAHGQRFLARTGTAAFVWCQKLLRLKDSLAAGVIHATLGRRSTRSLSGHGRQRKRSIGSLDSVRPQLELLKFLVFATTDEVQVLVAGC